MTEIPGYTLAQLEDYRDKHRPVGGFLRALLANDLMSAVLRADSENIHALPAITHWAIANLPSHAWGSYAQVAAWTDPGNLV